MAAPIKNPSRRRATRGWSLAMKPESPDHPPFRAEKTSSKLLRVGLLARGFRTRRSFAVLAFPNVVTLSGSRERLPTHSGATAPASHRFPFYALAGTRSANNLADCLPASSSRCQAIRWTSRRRQYILREYWTSKRNSLGPVFCEPSSVASRLRDT